MKIFALSLGLTVCLALQADAHFIFLELPPEKPTCAQLRFSEEPLEETSPALQEKSAPFTVQTGDGTPVPFSAGEGAREGVIPEDTALLKGSLDYGVMDRGGIYLLAYHAKATRNTHKTTKIVGLPLEVLAQVKDGALVVTVLLQGKPAAGAELVVNLPTVKKQAEATTNAEGQATFPIEVGGWVGIRAKAEESRSGTLGDKAYEVVRHYSTLTFPYFTP